MTESVIEASDLTKLYGDSAAIDKINFQVNKGEIVGLLGPNGAGKSTTMKILTCYTAPTSGTASVCGFDVFDSSLEVRRRIGYLPEATPLYQEMMVLEYLQFAAEMRSLAGDAAKKAIKRVVEQADLGDVIGKEIRTLSKGYRQRVGLAQALVHEPPLLILDEPMSGLDPNQAHEVREVIKEIGRERTVILSTHNLAEVKVTCDRVLIISRGHIVADDRPSDLQKRMGRARYTLHLQRDGKEPAAVARDFSSVSGVASVKPLPALDGELSFEVLPSADQDLRAALFRAAVAKDYTLLGLSREGQNLEDVFRDLTVGETDEAA